MMDDLMLVENEAYKDDENFKDYVTSLSKLTNEEQAIAANK